MIDVFEGRLEIMLSVDTSVVLLRLKYDYLLLEA